MNTKNTDSIKKEEKSVKEKVKNIVIAILLLLLIILGILWFFNQKKVADEDTPKPNDIEIQTGEVIEVPEEEKAAPGMLEIFPMYDFTVDEEHVYQTLGNSELNNYYLAYSFTNKETKEVVYESKKLEPGFYYSVDFYEAFKGVKGTYEIEVLTTAYDMETGDLQGGSATQTIHVTIN